MTVISGTVIDSLRRPHQEFAQPSLGGLSGYAVADDRRPAIAGIPRSSEPGRIPEPDNGTLSETVHVQQREKSVRLACGCGHFVLSFHSLGVIRRGRFRCPLCGWMVRLSRLEALREICRVSAGEDVWTSLSKAEFPDPD